LSLGVVFETKTLACIPITGRDLELLIHVDQDRSGDPPSARLSRRGARQRHQSHADRHPLSPPDRRGRQAPRLRRPRRVEDQGVAAEDGRGGHRVILHRILHQI